VDVLVTGGAGYIGCVLVRQLLAAGHGVTVLDSLLYGRTQHSLMHLCHEPRFQFVFGDARDRRVLGDLLPGHDAIVPLAALVGAPICARHPREAEEINVQAIRSLTEMKEQSQALVFPATNSSYGHRTDDLPCTEETPVSPISDYGKGKAEAEEAVLLTSNVVSLRFATVFGVSQRMRLDLLVNDFVHRAYRDGFLSLYEPNFRRSYLHIEDAAAAIRFSLENHGTMQKQAYNVGLDGVTMTKCELAEAIRQVFPSLQIHLSEEGRDPDQRNYVTSTAKLRAVGFTASRPVEQGIEELAKAFGMMQTSEYGNFPR
jgi:nucleoside-diphosphate-sugar epimerase